MSLNIVSKFLKTNLVKDSGLYTLFNILEKAIPFLILPIITRVLSKEEVGIYILYQAIIEVLLPFMTLNIDSSILLNYYKVSDKKFKVYFSNGIALFLFVFIISFIFVFIFSDKISEIIQFPANWLLIICVIIGVRFFTQIRQHLWRIKYKIKEYGFFSIGISLVKNGVGLALIYFSSYGWEGLIIGHLIGYALFAVIALVTFYKEKVFTLDFDINYVIDAYRVGYPIALHKVGLWLGDAANRIIIAGVLGTAATGSYGIGASFALIVTVIEDAFNKAFVPHLFEKLKNLTEIHKYDIIRLSYLIYLFITVLATFVFIVGYFGVVFIYGDEYISTRQYMLPLILAAMLKGYYKLHVNYILFTKKTMKITQITVSTGILNLFLAYYMTVYFGVIGTAYSLLIINLIQYCFTFYVSNKLLPMPWKFQISK